MAPNSNIRWPPEALILSLAGCPDRTRPETAQGIVVIDGKENSGCEFNIGARQDQQQTPETPRLDNTSPTPRRRTTTQLTNQCCDDRWNSP